MGKPESKIEMLLVNGVTARGGWAAKMVDAGRRGAPDRECRFPNGRIIFVETKAPGGKLKPWQEEYHRDLRKLGFHVLTLWTEDQVNAFLKAYDACAYV
jgi:hypothetical protein